jgi:predicted glycogen debranching enzyme
VYEVSAKRGEEEREDQYNPGYFAVKLDQGYQMSILASLRNQQTFSTKDLRYREMQRVRKLTAKLSQADSFLLALVDAAHTFIVKRKSTGTKSVIAGYHWFGYWGRVATICIPGLTLVTKREEEGKEIVKTFLSFLRDGLIPNSMPDSMSEPDYASIDASLWLINACYAIYSETGSLEFVREVYPNLQEIVSAYIHGTKFGIGLDEDGLVKAARKNLRSLGWTFGLQGGL